MRWRTGTVGLSLVAAALAVGASGCVGERDFPKPTEMCENLVTACGVPVLLEHPNDIFRQCHQVGVAGQKDRANEAQCFASYDECLNECEFYGYYLTLDSGADADSSADAMTELDAAVELPDAVAARDE